MRVYIGGRSCESKTKGEQRVKYRGLYLNSGGAKQAFATPPPGLKLQHALSRDLANSLPSRICVVRDSQEVYKYIYIYIYSANTEELYTSASADVREISPGYPTPSGRCFFFSSSSFLFLFFTPISPARVSLSLEISFHRQLSCYITHYVLYK